MMRRVMVCGALILLLTACNVWRVLIDTTPATNPDGRILITDPTPTRETLPEIVAPSAPTTDRADGSGQAVTGSTPPTPLPPPPPERATDAATPCIAPPGGNCALE